jgi:hypothetical protein
VEEGLDRRGAVQRARTEIDRIAFLDEPTRVRARLTVHEHLRDCAECGAAAVADLPCPACGASVTSEG